MMDEEIVFLTLEEAEKILPDRDKVHTFRNSRIALLGCDWDKKDIIDAMKKFSDTLQLSGKTATSMGHGLVIEDDHGYLFIETKQDGDK
jgi:hypothetical protein